VSNNPPFWNFQEKAGHRPHHTRTFRGGVGGRPRHGPAELKLSTGVKHLPGIYAGKARGNCVVCKEKSKEGVET
jgi:hypothetical protein